MKTGIDFKVGDRVARKKEPETCGEIVSIDDWNCCKIKWDKKSGKYGIEGIGQQHSTLQKKFLIHV